MKSFVAWTYLAFLVGALPLSAGQASAAKAPVAQPFDQYDPRWGFDREMIEDAENEKYKVCDPFPGKGKSQPPKKCKGLSP
jgi:hypothetical protein